MIINKDTLFEKIKTEPFFIVGPCVIENLKLLRNVATTLKELQIKHNINIIFKSSFDKANRTSIDSFRGPLLEKGLNYLKIIKDEFELPILTDIHEPFQALQAAEVADILQIPAFLCRQTDLLLRAGETNAIINIKKAQFLSGSDMKYPVNKVYSTGNKKVFLTERGNIYGYNNLVVDFRNIPVMKSIGVPVVMDCTHSVQRPGVLGGETGGDRKFAPLMAKAAKEFGANGYFFETHPNPDKALSDGANMVYLDQIEKIILSLI